MGSTMEEVSKIFFVAFWVFSFTHVKSQECSTGTIQYENVQRSDLLKTYPNEATVKVNCATGYIGSYKLHCENGNWRTLSERECKKNPCDHPGDTPNGDFKLTLGSEFVFGARVKYTCRTGYKMASRIDYRDCRVQGWDNAVPVCEVEKSVCAEALQNGFILKSSRGFFYSCDSDYKPFYEKWWEELTCLDGQWSNATLCIPNHQCGQVPTDHQTNNQAIKGYENESVEEFQCESGPCCFKCVNGNWEKRNCEFQGCPNPPYVENAVITSHSQQTVTYECRDNYSINGKKTISCINSEWEKTPTCTLGGNNRCSDPERVINNGFLRKADLKEYYEEGSQEEYWCKDGFQFENESHAICSAGQWNYPQCKPLVRNLRCQFPEREINNAILRRADLKAYYETGSFAQYRCTEGFHFEDMPYAECSEGRWKYPRCV